MYAHSAIFDRFEAKVHAIAFRLEPDELQLTTVKLTPAVLGKFQQTMRCHLGWKQGFFFPARGVAR